MSNHPLIQQYKQISITTANRGQLLILLYEAAIRNTKKAIQSIQKNDLSSKGKYITKTIDIINELSTTLNFEIGGELAVSLENIYLFLINQLVTANIEKSTDPLHSVQKILETLLSGWKEAVKKFNQKNDKK